MIIYTVITNEYDTLKEPKVVTSGWQYVCFSDRPLKSKVWEIRLIDSNPGIDRMIKIKAHDYFDYDIAVYVDGSFLIKGNLDELIDHVPTTFSLPIHRRRDCIYEEAEFVLGRDMIAHEQWEEQKERYQQEGFPAEWGLGRNGILVRDLADPKVRALNEHWWREYENGVKRDQLSMMYCFWKANWDPDLLLASEFRNYFKLKKHNVHRG